MAGSGVFITIWVAPHERLPEILVVPREKAPTRAPPPAFPRTPRGRLGFPGPTQGPRCKRRKQANPRRNNGEWRRGPGSGGVRGSRAAGAPPRARGAS